MIRIDSPRPLNEVEEAKRKGETDFSPLATFESADLKEEVQVLDPVSDVFGAGELLLGILERVPLASLGKAASTCRSWSNAVKDTSFCRERYKLDFPFSTVPQRDIVAVYYNEAKQTLALRNKLCQVSTDAIRSQIHPQGLGAVLLNNERLISGSKAAKVSRPGIHFHANPEGGSRRMHLSGASALTMEKHALYTGHPNGEICVWELEQGNAVWQQTNRFRGGVHKITALLEQDDFFFAADVLGRVHMWTLQGRLISSPFVHLQEVRCLEKREDSIFSAGKEGRIWECRATPGGLEKKLAFSSGNSPITCLHHFHDMLLAGAEDGTLAVWEKVEGTTWIQKVGLKSSELPITALSSYGNFVFCASEQGELKVWEYERGSWKSFELPQQTLSSERHIIGFYCDAANCRLHCAHSDGYVSIWDFSVDPSSMVR